jgi:hypothetical protein
MVAPSAFGAGEQCTARDVLPFFEMPTVRCSDGHRGDTLREAGGFSNG